MTAPPSSTLSLSVLKATVHSHTWLCLPFFPLCSSFSACNQTLNHQHFSISQTINKSTSNLQINKLQQSPNSSGPVLTASITIIGHPCGSAASPPGRASSSAAIEAGVNHHSTVFSGLHTTDTQTPAEPTNPNRRRQPSSIQTPPTAVVPSG